jgi:exodeoxyribonuclease VII small subunit
MRIRPLGAGAVHASSPRAVGSNWLGVEIEYAIASDPRTSGDNMAKTSATAAKKNLPADDGGSLDLSYEEALAELEGLVARMEAGQLPLDQLLTSYQRGAQLLKACREKLDAVEEQVKLLEAGQLKPLSAP